MKLGLVNKCEMTRKAKLEEERNYTIVTRKRKETGALVKSFLRFLFSQVGLVLLCIAIAVAGWYSFIHSVC